MREALIRRELRRLAGSVELPDTCHEERAQELVGYWLKRHPVIRRRFQEERRGEELANVCRIAESVIDHCETCGELLDRDCQGQYRCPNCGGPCLDCYDGPGPGEDTQDTDDTDEQ